MQRATRTLTPPALLLLALLPGCRLIDQRTFEGTGLYPAAGQLARADYAQRALPPPPLLTIRFGGGESDWQTPLVQAVHDAQDRKPDVTFDLVTPLPASASLAAQDAAAKTGTQDAGRVADILQEAGVTPDHIRIGARGDAGNPPREIEVYVR